MRANVSKWLSRGGTLAAFVLLVVGCSAVPRSPGPEVVSASPPSKGEAPIAPDARTVAAVPSKALVRVGIATGNERETDYRIGRDLAEFVAPDAGLALDVRATKGSAENMHLLRDDPAIDLAIVQYDVVQALVEQAAKGNAAAARLVKPLRVVMPLYTQEIYLIVRSDSPLKSFNEIKGRKINVGVQGSGSALTIASLYERMFKTPIAAANIQYLSDDRALAALTVDRSVDVVAVVAGQPAKLFTDMKPQARQYIKLLGVDETQPATQAAYKLYFPATIRVSSYASWLQQDVPTLSVLSFLVTSDQRIRTFEPSLVAFARSMCRNVETLKAQGHAKWREVELGRQIGFRLVYAGASETEFERCAGRRRLSAAKP